MSEWVNELTGKWGDGWINGCTGVYNRVLTVDLLSAFSEKVENLNNYDL